MTNEHCAATGTADRAAAVARRLVALATTGAVLLLGRLR